MSNGRRRHPLPTFVPAQCVGARRGTAIRKRAVFFFRPGGSSPWHNFFARSAPRASTLLTVIACAHRN
jgi:hypothetical protein